MPKKKGVKCAGFIWNKKMKKVCPCPRMQVEFEGELIIYCENHIYFLEFTQEIIEGIKNSTNTYKACGRCLKWHNLKTSNCTECITYEKEHAQKKKEENLHLKCKLIFPDTKTQCSYNHLDEKKFCEKHKHMEDYTEEMLNNLKRCSCNFIQYVTFFCEYETCDTCRNRGKKNRQIVSDATKLLPRCKIEGCPNAGHNEGWCGKHDKHRQKEKIEQRGNRVCGRFDKGCTCELTIDYVYSWCQDCLKNEPIRDQTYRDKIYASCQDYNKETLKLLDVINILNQLLEKLNLLEENATKKYADKIIDKYGTDELRDDYNQIMSTFETIYFDDQIELDKVAMNTAIKISDRLLKKISLQFESSLLMCTKCAHKNNVEQFMNQYNHITSHCLDCRKDQQIIEDRRPKRTRDYKTYDAKPEVKQRKKEWRENNPEKVKLYDVNHKNKQIIAKGEKVWLENAIRQRQWRTNNPEKCKQNNETKKANKTAKVNTYKYSANTRNIQWDLTDENALKLIIMPCYYCGEIDSYGLTGIDRLNNNLGYTNENAVSCCEICNFMKNTTPQDEYFDKTRHILSKMFISNEIFKCSKLFKNSASSGFKVYQKRATNKNLEFKLTYTEFEKIKRLDCYMCGKEASEYHLNGIDRLDNTNGYTLENCLPCCWDCNKLKNNWDIYDVIRKIYKMHFPTNPIDNIHITLNCYLQCTLKNNLNILTSVNTEEFDKKLKINANTIARENFNANGIKKYGEVNFKRLRALKEQIRLATIKKDIIKIKNIQTEIDHIEQNPNVEHTKKKLSKEEKTEKNKLKKQQERQNVKNTLGDIEYRKKMAKEKSDQRKKKKLLDELNKI